MDLVIDAVIEEKAFWEGEAVVDLVADLDGDEVEEGLFVAEDDLEDVRDTDGDGLEVLEVVPVLEEVLVEE